ncbi:MAG: hypothetical protein QG646_3474 [Euryarchaeota archaeon]|nr:hypothetical protein [Euryarchaeota archaeon]
MEREVNITGVNMLQDELSNCFKSPGFIFWTSDTKDDADYAHICFIRKYRDNHKKTKYVFKSPEIDTKKVSNKLLMWMKENFAKIDFDNICKYNPGVPQETNEWAILDGVSTWSYFKNPLEHNFDREISQNELDRMSLNFAGIMIFCKKNECFYGQITRLQPKFVLNNSESFLAIFDSDANNYISELRDEKGFRISSRADILFNTDAKKVTRSIIFSKKNFEDIFDLSWELEQNAISMINQMEVFVENPAFKSIQDVVKEDRIVQRMLNNRVLLEGEVKYLTFSELKRLKEIAGSILLFDISEDGKSFVLPDDANKGKALRQIIKAISRRYIVGGDNEIFMENAGITASWELFQKEMKEVKEVNDNSNS